MSKLLAIIVVVLVLTFIVLLVSWFINRKKIIKKGLSRGYLKAVYPAGSWDSLSDDNIDTIYNSLGYIYNPCSKYWGDDLTGVNDNIYDKTSSTYGQVVCGTTWNPLAACNDDMRAPHPPIGRFYSFKHYKDSNITSVLSDGTGDMSEWTSFRQTLHWGQSSTGGEISKTCRSGPGPYWIQPYSLVRDFYYPNGITFKNNKWVVTCKMSSDLPNFGCGWNTPANWTFGKKEGDYVEVTHAQNNPGMAQSIGFWFNAMPGGGTGVFLQIGKTHVANNKVDTLFTLLDKLGKSSASDLASTMSETKFAGKTGEEILISFYEKTDPYIITWKYINGEWTGMGMTNDNLVVVDPSNAAWAFVGNKGVLGASGLMRDPNNISTSGPDGVGYTPNGTVKFQDLAVWWSKQQAGSIVNTVADLTQDDKNKVIDAARNPKQDIDYFPNRAGGMVHPDEPICWLGFVLGIETIQMPMSANDNGMWVYEIIDLRIPTPSNTPGLPIQYVDWLKNARERKYGFLNGGGPNWPTWNVDAQRWWMVHMQKFLSARNPQDLSKGVACPAIGYITGLTANQCSSNPYLDVPDVHPLDSSGYYDSSQRCWVAVNNKGWQNLPCGNGSLAHQYIKIPLMYPATFIPGLTQASSGKKPVSAFYESSIAIQNPYLAQYSMRS